MPPSSLTRLIEKIPKWLRTAVIVSAANIMLFVAWAIYLANNSYEPWHEYLGATLIFACPSTILIIFGTALFKVSKVGSGISVFLGIVIAIFSAFLMALGIAISNIG
jgi:hypothetical protein